MRKFMINVNGQSYQVEVEEIGASTDSFKAQASAPVQPALKAEPHASAPAKASNIPANGIKIESPMPGTILSVKVSPGQKVKSGDILMILEAMKMENEILAPEDGTVSAIQVSQGATVQTGDLLIVIE